MKSIKIETFGVQPKFAEAVIGYSDDHLSSSDKVKIDDLRKSLYNYVCVRMGNPNFDAGAIHLAIAPVVNTTIGVCEVDRVKDVECTEIEVFLLLNEDEEHIFKNAEL